MDKWEEQHERPFLINGCNYNDIITNQWAAFTAQKEQEKLERVSNKLLFMKSKLYLQASMVSRLCISKHDMAIEVSKVIDVHVLGTFLHIEGSQKKEVK